LLAASGFRIVRSLPNSSQYSLIEAVPV
jgi:hypothetical protein